MAPASDVAHHEYSRCSSLTTIALPVHFRSSCGCQIFPRVFFGLVMLPGEYLCHDPLFGCHFCRVFHGSSRLVAEVPQLECEDLPSMESLAEVKRAIAWSIRPVLTCFDHEHMDHQTVLVLFDD